MKSRLNKKRLISVFIALIVLIILMQLIPNGLQINFIDVGQGDSCLIISPHNKTILIDGGGSNNSDYDIGKNILVPYLLDKGFSKIDIIMISHFDNDHVRTVF